MKEKKEIPKQVNNEPEWYVNRRTGEAMKTTKTKLRKMIFEKHGQANLTFRLKDWEKASEKEAEILEKYPD